MLRKSVFIVLMTICTECFCYRYIYISFIFVFLYLWFYKCFIISILTAFDSNCSIRLVIKAIKLIWRIVLCLCSSRHLDCRSTNKLYSLSATKICHYSANILKGTASSKRVAGYNNLCIILFNLHFFFFGRENPHHCLS